MCLPVVAVLGEEGERRCAAALDRTLEGRRGHPVHDDEHELLGHVRVYSSRASVRKPAYRSGRRRLSSGRRASSASAMRYPAAGIQASAATRSRRR